MTIIKHLTLRSRRWRRTL